MNERITYQARIQIRNGRHGRKELATVDETALPVEPGRIPRISRLMALAIRFDGMIKAGTVSDQAELARLGHVTRARMTQIMNLLSLAPDIQEELLFLPRVQQGYDPIHLKQLQPIAGALDWARQRMMWKSLERNIDSLETSLTNRSTNSDDH